MSNNKTSPLLIGTLGVFAGVIGGLLFAPRAGKETREEMIAKVRDIFGIYSAEFVEKFENVREAIEKRLIALKKTGTNIDSEKYMMVVDEVVTDFKSDINTTKDGFEKLSKYLKKDWEKVKKAIA
jgi:gas vesicle protein